MRVRLLSAAFWVLGGLCFPTITHAAKPPQHAAAPLRLVVIERFAQVHPRAGQRETVYARLQNGSKPIAGAKLTANLLNGAHRVATVPGAKTDKLGKAPAVFTVPKAVAGKMIRVQVVLKYGKLTFYGYDSLTVRA